jgi:hypothetical protein
MNQLQTKLRGFIMFSVKYFDDSNYLNVVYNSLINENIFIEDFANIRIQNGKNLEIIDFENNIFSCKVEENEPFHFSINNLSEDYNIGFPIFIDDKNIFKNKNLLMNLIK